MEQTPQKKVRNYGIDALRIISMLMIVTLHVLGKGGILYKTEPFSLHYHITWLMEIACFGAVNCYAMISGYVGVKSKHRYSSLIMLWLRVIFFTLIITGLFQYFMPQAVHIDQWIRAILPVTYKQYWYFTAYFGLFIFIPILNSAITSLSQKDLRNIIIALILVFSVFYSAASTFTSNDLFFMSDGYSIWWLMILYVIGGYIGLYEPFKKVKKYVLFLIYIGMTVLTWAVKWITEIITLDTLGKIQYNRLLVKYTSPTVLIASAALLLLFRELKFHSVTDKIIGFFAPSAFSVYLIHTHPLIWTYIITDRFTVYDRYGSVKMTLYIIGTVFAIYIVCSLIDVIREYLFKLLKIKELLRRIDKIH